MQDALVIPDGLEICQRLLRELSEAHAELQRVHAELPRVHEELVDTCGSLQASQEKLQQHQAEPELTIQRLQRQLYGKSALHVPLYRQPDMFSPLGWCPSRSTLCTIVATAAEVLASLAELLRQRVFLSPVLGTDDPPVRLRASERPQRPIDRRLGLA